MCNGRSAFSDRSAECGCSVTHPSHPIGIVPFGHGGRFDSAHAPRPVSPFVRRALSRELPAKEIAR